jgi:hypothetical protein
VNLKPWEYGHEDIDVTDTEITGLETEIQAAVTNELGIPDWDVLDDDVLNFEEMNPFGTIG